MKRSLAMAMQVAVLLGPAIAQEDLGAATRAAFCSTVEDGVARLACFDKAFPRGEFASSAAAQPPKAVEAPTKWSVEVGKSAVDGSPMFVAMLSPTEASGAGIGRGSIALVLRCAQNTTSVSFSTDAPMMEDTVPVTISIDGAPAVSSSWSRSETGNSVGLWRGATAIPFIRSLRDNGLAVRIGEPGRVDAQFNVGNVGDVAQQIAEACEWPVVAPKPGTPQNSPMELGIQ